MKALGNLSHSEGRPGAKRTMVLFLNHGVQKLATTHSLKDTAHIDIARCPIPYF
jgi:hypothetical protein